MSDTKGKKSRCWFFHDWSTWEQYSRTMIYYMYKTGEKIDSHEDWQKRHCLRCGYAQDEEVRGS